MSAAVARSLVRLVEVMSEELVTVGPRASTFEAARVAEEEGVHHLLVVDGDDLVGVVCEYDLLLAGPLALVEQCMNEPTCVDADATLPEVARIMRERAVGCLPVVTSGFLRGIVTRGDLRRAGLPVEEVAGPACASCGGEDHVRLDPRTQGAMFCIECSERASQGAGDDELGGSG